MTNSILTMRMMGTTRYIEKMISLFKRPYPFYYYNPKRLLKISLLVSIFIILFLFLIKPFDTKINEFRYGYFVTCSIYGIVSGFSVYFTAQSLSVLFPAFFKEEKWTLAWELLVLIILLLVLGNINFLIRNLVNTNPDNFKVEYYLEEIAHTCLIGIFPVVFFTLLNYSYLFKTNNNKAVIANIIINQKHNTADSGMPHLVTIKSQSIYDTVSLSVPDICFIKSDGNYIEIYQNTEGKIKKYIIRNTLKDVEGQLAGYPDIIKTHRSYLVNIGQVGSVKGNAQGYMLQMKNCEIPVPVSRNSISQFNSCINSHVS
jgi:hypothetical protein